jgi:hypothetical protein
MFGVQNSFGGFCAFLQGIDAGNDWQLFIGFREFLVIRARFGTNLAWHGLILRLAFPHADFHAADSTLGQANSKWSRRLPTRRRRPG